MIDLLIVLLFISYSVYSGFRARKKASENLEEYFLAGRTLKGWQAGMSMAATQFSADTPLLVCGLVATAGIFSLWRLWIYALAFLMMAFVFSKGWRRAGVLTDAEFTVLRYSRRGATGLRALKAIYMGTCINCAVLAMVLLAAMRIAEPFLLWHEWLPPEVFNFLKSIFENNAWILTNLSPDHPQVFLYSTNNFISILLIVLFTVLYSMTGGLRGVVATDIVQFIVAMAGTFFYAAVMIRKIGGLHLFPEKLTGLYGEAGAVRILAFGPHDLSDVGFVFIGVLAVQWFAQVNADGTGYLAQRSMACRSDAEAKKAAVFFTFAQIVLRSLLWLPIALGLLIIYPAETLIVGEAGPVFQAAREGLFAQGIKDILPAGLRGFMLTGMLAALASTLDTHLNWGASYWANDLYKGVLMEKILKKKPAAKELVWVARFSNLLILSIALCLTVYVSSIQTAWHISLLFGSGLGVVLILRWLWHRINLHSEITAIVVSIIVAPVLLFAFPGLSEGARLLAMLFISSGAVLGVTLLTKPEAELTLKNFYERVEPMGWWGPVADLCGERPEEPRRRLKKAVAAMAACALTVFCWLIGLGTWITGASFFFKPFLLVLTGCLTVLFWFKQLSPEEL